MGSLQILITFAVPQLERYYYRRMYPQQYNSYYSSMAGYNQPGAAASYYNNYQQPYYQQPSVYQSPYNTLGYGYNTSPYQQSVYNNTPYSSSLYGTPAAYGYSNSYYPNYLQRTYM